MRLIVFGPLRRLVFGRLLILFVTDAGDRVSSLDLVFELLVFGRDVAFESLGSPKLTILVDAQHTLLLDAPKNRGREWVDLIHADTAGGKDTTGSIGQIGASLYGENRRFAKKTSAYCVWE